MYPEHQERSAAEGDLSPVELRVHFATESSAARVREPSQEVIAFKFGGTSLLGAERMRHAAGLVREAARHSAVTVVVSAMKGITDQLLGIARSLEQGERQIARSEAQSVINLHLVTLRDPFVGYVLPSKVHACIASGKRILFVGSESSDVHLLASRALPPDRYCRVNVGDVDGLVHTLHAMERAVVSERKPAVARIDRDASFRFYPRLGSGVG